MASKTTQKAHTAQNEVVPAPVWMDEEPSFTGLQEQPLTEEATLEDIEVLSEPNPLWVKNPEDGYDYFWASKNPFHPQYWKTMERYGWRLVSAVGGKETNCFGRQEYETLILMRRRSEITEEIRRRRRSKWETKVASAEKDIQEFGDYAQKIIADAEKNRTIFV